MNKKDYGSTKSLDHYYYDKQFRKYVAQFMAIFTDLYVDISKEDENDNLISVPIRYGHADRVVEAIITSNTQNKPLRLPLMSANVINLEFDLTRTAGLNQSKTTTQAGYGESIPDGLKTLTVLKPFVYDMTFELSLYASNTDQMFQMMEQILMLFDPILMIQTSDDATDHTSLTQVKLDTIVMDTNFPIDDGGRFIVTTMTFTTKAYLSAPAEIKNNVINKIKLRVKSVNDLNDINVDILDEEGYEDVVDGTDLKLD